MRKKTNNKLINGIIVFGIICLIISLFIMLKNRQIPNHITSINYEEYSELINRDEYSIILLTTPTCTHCNSYKPQVNRVCDDYNLMVYNLSLNDLSYDEYMEIHDKYTATKDHYLTDGKASILTPTTIITKNGEEVSSISGNLGYSGFVDLLNVLEIIKK